MRYIGNTPKMPNLVRLEMIIFGQGLFWARADPKARAGLAQKILSSNI